LRFLLINDLCKLNTLPPELRILIWLFVARRGLLAIRQIALIIATFVPYLRTALAEQLRALSVARTLQKKAEEREPPSKKTEGDAPNPGKKPVGRESKAEQLRTGTRDNDSGEGKK